MRLKSSGEDVADIDFGGVGALSRSRAATAPRKPLGETLQQRGSMDAAQIDRVLMFQRDQGGLFGEIAVELGLVSPADRDRALASQASLTVLDQGDDRLDPALVAAFDPNAAYVGKLRAVRARVATAINLAQDFENCRLALLSVGVSEDASIFAANFAIVLAQFDGETLLIDAAVEHPSLHALFNISNRDGLIRQLQGDFPDIAAQQTAVERLMLMPVGPASTSAQSLIERGAFLDEIRRWDLGSANVVTFFQIESAASSSIGTVLAGFDAVVLLGRRNSTAMREMRRVIDMLDAAKVPIAGSVIV